jgi:hypothetical protein
MGATPSTASLSELRLGLIGCGRIAQRGYVPALARPAIASGTPEGTPATALGGNRAPLPTVQADRGARRNLCCRPADRGSIRSSAALPGTMLGFARAGTAVPVKSPLRTPTRFRAIRVRPLLAQRWKRFGHLFASLSLRSILAHLFLLGARVSRRREVAGFRPVPTSSLPPCRRSRLAQA